MLRSIAYYLAVALGLLLAIAGFNAARVRPADAPPTAFSAERAMVDVAAIGRAPHPIGSAEAGWVREGLARQLSEAGFEVEVFRAPALMPPREGAFGLAGAYPETLVAVRPGQNRALPPVAIMSHYDSVAGSPGAADDAAGVSASLEVARAIAAGGPVARDLVLIITDGEEAGLFGARAFFRAHPLARRLGVVLNLETRGSSGPNLMFETSPQAGALVRRFAATAPGATTNSLLAWVYANMPNDTDFTLAREAGIAGLNFGFIGRPFDYHSATATAANLDRHSLQAMGDQVLGVTRSLLGAEALPAKSANLVYSDVFGLFVLAYPAWAGWLILLVAVGLFGLSLRRLGPVRPAPVEILRGAGAFLLITVYAVFVLHVLGRLMPTQDNPYQNRVVADFGLYLAACGLLTFAFVSGLTANLLRGEGRWRGGIFALIVAAICTVTGGFDPLGVGLAVTAAVLCWALLNRAIAPTAMWSGFLVFGIVLGVGLQLFAPQLAFMFVWPLLIGAALAAGLRLGIETGRIATAAAIVVGALVFGWMARAAGLAFDGLGITTPEALVVFVVPALCALAPLSARAGLGVLGRPVAVVALAAGVIVAAFVGVHDGASARYPKPSQVLHVTDLAHGRTLLVSGMTKPDPWTLEVLGKNAKAEPLPGMLVRRAVATPTAPVTPFTTPTAVAGRDGERATLTLNASGAREIRFSVKGAPLKHLTVAGLPTQMKGGPDGWSVMRWYAPRDGVVLAFDAPAGTQLDWRLAAIGDSFPAAFSPPARPASIMPWQNSDSQVVIAEGKVAW
ncbi:MAG: hypothetical protein BGN86_09600 [Caulobacterales bacterium 68-7]|nr:MAG: hypothetical protein BGN86_09600 [Caulobacterales bacterium 68-7]